MSLLKNRLDLFYILAFAPLLLIQYFGYIARGDFFAVLIPLYGFLILLIKKDRLSVFSEPDRMYRLIGLIFVLASFFVYYAVALLYPSAQFYGVANYTVYVVGLFLFFFQPYALKESFTTLFLIVAAVASHFVGQWMKSYLEPAVPYFVQIMGFILWILGIPATIANPHTFSLQMPDGEIMHLGVEAGCIGIDSFLIFVIIIVVIIIEDPSRMRTKLLWSVGGVIGTFCVNIVRVSLIFVVIFYFGYKGWGEIHNRIGYVLLIAWLAFFLLIFSKRQTILNKLQRFWQRLR